LTGVIADLQWTCARVTPELRPSCTRVDPLYIHSSLIGIRKDLKGKWKIPAVKIKMKEGSFNQD
jgi:hypothetical protein